MARKDVENFKVAESISKRLRALIVRAKLNSSANQILEQLLSECCDAVENSEGPTMPATVRELRTRIGLLNPVVSLDELKREHLKLGARLEEAVAKYEGSSKKKPS